MHEGNKHMDDLTMNQFLEKYVKETWIQTSHTFKPAFCFRLDKDTSWIVIAGKNYEALRHLNELIRQHIPEKHYLAITKWVVKNKHIIQPLEKIFDKKFWKSKVIVSEDGQHAESIVKKLQSKEDEYLWKISLAQIQLLTGRMHQIRVHLAHNKWPIIWDLMYWDPVINRLAKKYYQITRQLLHSRKYKFEYKWKKYDITAPIPEDFNRLFSII
jgi:23S rRNA pseudouridine955/2504/2580 synthase